MKLPIWLYAKRDDGVLRIRRYGSRRPLRVVATIIDSPNERGSGYGLASSYMFDVGRLGVQFGPEGGVDAGFSSMPRGSRCKLFSLRGGLAIGLTWEARA